MDEKDKAPEKDLTRTPTAVEWLFMPRAEANARALAGITDFLLRLIYRDKAASVSVYSKRRRDDADRT